MDALGLVTKLSKLLSNSCWLKSGVVGIKFSPLLRRDFSASDREVYYMVIITYNTAMTLQSGEWPYNQEEQMPLPTAFSAVLG